MYADFEIGLLMSIRQNFPKTQIKCCYFHLLQAWWRAANKMGLKQNNIKFFTRILIENFKISVHIKESLLINKFLNNIDKLFEENKLNLENEVKDRLKTFYSYVFKTYFDEKNVFSQYILHRSIFKILLLSIKLN